MNAQAARVPQADERQSARICSILTSLTSGGAENLVTNLNVVFAAEIVSPTVLTMCEATTLGNSASMEATLGRRLADAGCHVRSLSLGAGRGLLKSSLVLRRFLKREQPQLVHAHTVRAALMLGLAGYRGAVVCTHHNSRLSFPPSLFRILDRIVDHYVAISADVAGLYRSHSRRPFTVIPNAPAPSLRATSPRTRTDSRPRILTVGAISQQKNYTLLIETARVMQARAGPGRPAPLFRIAGGGADLARLQAQVSSLGLTDIIEFLGERADVPDLLVESDVYLNTSLYEGFSIAILEALSSAVPVVATDVPGNSGLVRTGYNGLLCAERPEALAAAIERVTSESTLYRRLSEGALASVANFTLDGAARRHLDLYDSLLRRRAARRD
ncbi:glycosyltransferase [Novosphingobium panipatense]|uniref:Glycosyltransferase involved in cell wall bisynthesis n=1 Tax=Novosphingobium panipatense TaxID=428991 RepID=A0ABY1QLP9_9SPHN|nr:glycosyltransferase [Novosphingobium panipatense]SMP71838.1 Glycosyltransferase involved in cell wall bisynthesis [Novosphingobium panipatense]